MNDPGCRGVRDLLGVYVVGAIDSADRGIADAHLSTCLSCREELAGLAGLPALLRRVPLAQAEQLAAPAGPGPAGGSGRPPLPPELLSDLLARLAARRRARRLRSALALAAVAVVAAGGAAMTARLFAVPARPGPSSTASSGPRLPGTQAGLDVAQATSGPYHAFVQYRDGSWNSAIWVRLTGARPGTACRFWLLTSDGGRLDAGGWTVWPGTGQLWYQARSPASAGRVTAFLITAGGKTLIQVPAS